MQPLFNRILLRHLKETKTKTTKCFQVKAFMLHQKLVIFRDD